ncbi:MAG TPA: xanthine dehydrogenase family protein molybdopterin-binding subunit [Gammaproteobacteria bacterium]|nr:xanthine dehydrogenase family protein molybdopterin-binding subunit [Gammaproteobacteria bacterium]
MSTLQNPGRRSFMVTTAAAGSGLLLAFALGSCGGASSPNGRNGFRPNGWLRITPGGRIIITVAEAEMGQGVHTSLAMLVAEELEVTMEQVEVEQAPVDNRLYGWQYTGGSTSVREGWEPMRRAGATARQMLIEAAARRWQVPPGECRARLGVVEHPASGKRATYGELASAAAQLDPPSQVSLKDPARFRLIGRATGEVEAVPVVTGRLRYASDLKLPGMLTAVVVHCPVFGGGVRSVASEAALQVAGVRRVLEIEEGVVVLAEHFWAAQQGARALRIEWDYGAAAGLDSAGIRKLFQSHADRFDSLDQELARALESAPRRLEVDYHIPFQAHAVPESICCTVHIHDGICEVWVPTQSPSEAQEVAARLSLSRPGYLLQKLKGKLLGRPFDAVRIHNMRLGGGFGRRLEVDYVVEAVKIAKLAQAPVRLLWPREEEIQHGYYRPASLHRMRAGLDQQGMPLAWHQLAVGAGGFRSPYYSIPAKGGDTLKLESGVPTGSWRSVGSSYNAFVIEGFVDELAAAAGRDPLDYRLALLEDEPRFRAVIELAAEKAGWGGRLPEGHHLGLAAHPGFGSLVAQVVELSADRERGIRIHRIVCAIDCGQVVNPDTVKAQMEGGIIFGLTATLAGAITIRNGRVEQSNLHDFPLLRMGEVPPIDVYIVPSSAPPGGVGEPGVPPIAPAVGNALYAATGKRIRELPVKPEELFQ